MRYHGLTGLYINKMEDVNRAVVQSAADIEAKCQHVPLHGRPRAPGSAASLALD